MRLGGTRTGCITSCPSGRSRCCGTFLAECWLCRIFLTMGFDGCINIFYIVDIEQHQSCTMCSGRANYDISATENLLNDGLRIADTLDLIHAECLVESG